MNCPLCGGDLERKQITYVQEFEGRVIIIEDVPADVCTQCHEKLLAPDIVREIQRIVWEAPAPEREERVPVYKLTKVA